MMTVMAAASTAMGCWVAAVAAVPIIRDNMVIYIISVNTDNTETHHISKHR